MRRKLKRTAVIRTMALLAALGGAGTLTACGWFGSDEPVVAVPGGDPSVGRSALRDYGCIACHSVPGVRGPDTYVGPPLDHWVQRRYIAGRVPNDLDNLVQWIQVPASIDPETAMPTLGVSEEDARHIAAYLYTLE